MSGETEKPTSEQPAAEKKPVRGRKPRAAPAAEKDKKPKATKTASHPPYFEMIKEALVALNEKSGSSPYAIAKYMEEKHKAVLPANFRKILSLQLKNSAAKGKLTKIRASYKLFEAGKKDKAAATAALKIAPAAAKRPRAAASKRKAEAAAKKVPKKGKKATPTKAKQPKSIKSPSGKRAKKSV